MVSNVVGMATQADAVNLHGKVTDVLVVDAHFESTGDDMFVLWGGNVGAVRVCEWWPSRLCVLRRTYGTMHPYAGPHNV